MIVGKKLTASKSRIVAGRFSGGSISPVGTLPADFDFTNGGNPLTALPAILTALNATYTRNSLKNVPQNGALVALSANQFGTSYDDVTGLYGYVPEPAATNLATNSDGNAATYTVSNTANGTAVPGFTSGIAYGDNSVLRYAYKQLTLTAATAYSVSFFVIMDDGNAPVVGASSLLGDFSIILDGSFCTNAIVRSIGSGVYRVSGSISSVTGGATRNCGAVKYATTQTARTFRITGIQVETGLRATSYIATAGSTASRSADVLTVPLANITGFSSAGYTLFVDGRLDVQTSTERGLVSIDDGTANNRAQIRQNASNLVATAVVSGGVAQASNAEASVGIARYRAAYSVSANSFIRAVNGVAGTADTAGSMPVLPTTLQLGKNHATDYCNGYIFRVGLIPQALTQAQLNGLTT